MVWTRLTIHLAAITSEKTPRLRCVAYHLMPVAHPDDHASNSDDPAVQDTTACGVTAVSLGTVESCEYVQF